MKFLKTPTSLKDDPTITWKQDGYRQTYKDSSVPSSKIPNDCVREAFNILLFGGWWQVREGTELHSDIEMPAIPGRTGYHATKTGNIITATSGAPFVASDVDSFFVWPSSGHHDIITQFISSTSVRVKHSDPEVPTNGGWVRGPINARPWWDDYSKKLYLFIGQRLYWTTWDMEEWTEIYILNGVLPSSTFSKFTQYRSFLYLINASGVYRIDCDVNPLVAWKTNTPLQLNTITEVAPTDVLIHQYDYIYAMARLTGTGNRNRGTVGVIVKQQTGPNALNPANDDKDYATVSRMDAIGAVGGTYQVLQCGPTGRTVAQWYATLAGGIGSFKIQLNGSPGGWTISVSFSGMSNDDGMEVYAARIQNAMRTTLSTYAPDATCVWDGTAFVITAGATAGNTVSYITAGGVGTNIGDNNWMNGGDPGAGGNGLVTNWGNPTVIGPFNVPANTYHLTHYPLYRNKDKSVATNNPNQFIWVDDFPIAKAYDAYRSAVNGHIYITPGGSGAFEEGDIGNTIVFANGVTDTLMGYVSATECIGTGTLVAVGSQGAAIGGGRVMTAQQVGRTITRTAGGNFLSTDVGKPFFWANGFTSIIKRYIDANHVETITSMTNVSQGGTIEPTQRYYNDVISDEILDNRLKALDVLQNRYASPLPSSDVGVASPGFLFVGLRGDNNIYYCQMPLDKEFYVGYYNSAFQTQPLHDVLTDMQEYPDEVVFLCGTTTRWTPTNQVVNTPSQAGDNITTIVGVNVADKSIGVRDIGSLVMLPGGEQAAISNEPHVRVFNGRSWSKPLDVDENGFGYIYEDLCKLQSAVAAGYDEKFGYAIFGSDEEL